MPDPTLYLVATPIGNLEDVTLRALRVLRETPCLYAEDTRRTRVLLDHHGISVAVRSLHAHNEAGRTSEVLGRLRAGDDVALVSDAGTPLVSDPGERLVRAVLEAGFPVCPIPGASSVLGALVGSGLPVGRFLFEGFLPRRAGERGRRLDALSGREETLVLFESPRRVEATLAELLERFGDRDACIARELTKLHEEFLRGRLSELAGRVAARPPRGEVTLVVAGAEARVPDAEELRAEIEAALEEGSSPRAIADALSSRSGVRRREVYALALALRDGGADGEDG